MEIEVKTEGEIHVVSMSGSLDTDTSPGADQRLTALFDQEAKHIVVDLSQVEYVSSAGLRVFLAASKKMRVVSGKLGLCGLNETVQEVFEISGFATILNVFDTLEQALASDD